MHTLEQIEAMPEGDEREAATTCRLAGLYTYDQGLFALEFALWEILRCKTVAAMFAAGGEVCIRQLIADLHAKRAEEQRRAEENAERMRALRANGDDDGLPF